MGVSICEDGGTGVMRPVRDRVNQNSPSLRNDDVVEGRMSLAESRKPDLNYHCAGCTSAALERILNRRRMLRRRTEDHPRFSLDIQRGYFRGCCADVCTYASNGNDVHEAVFSDCT